MSVSKLSAPSIQKENKVNWFSQWTKRTRQETHTPKARTAPRNKSHSEKIVLPRDDAFKCGQLLQWWYWTGHLKTVEGRSFGFEWAFFAVDLYQGKIGFQMLNFAVTDMQNKKHFHRVDYKPGLPVAQKDHFSISNFAKSVKGYGGNGKDELYGEIADLLLSLSIQSKSQPVLHYDGKKHRYNFGGDTYYYSRKWMDAKGHLLLDGQHFEVQGEAWFDRQYGNLFELTQVGWQWFSLRFREHRVMLFYIESAPEECIGSLTSRDGKSQILHPKDFSVSPREPFWSSPESGRSYATAWDVQILGQKYQIISNLKEQEISSKILPLKYWEGSCKIFSHLSSEVLGEAYVEQVNHTPTWLLALEKTVQTGLWMGTHLSRKLH